MTTTTTPPLRAAIYVRISQDSEGSGLGVKRQLTDCRAAATSRGWDVVNVFEDNDVSASSGKVRPAYRAMLAAIERGELDAFVVWDVDRLTRTPRELEDIIELANRHNIELASVGGDVDLGTPQGRLTARIKGNVARHEVEQMSRRIKRKTEERAAEGRPHGPVPFGYRRIDGRDVVYEPEAAIVRELARRILAGESLRSLAADLNTRGVSAPRSEWQSQTIRQLLRRPSVAGMRKHRGENIGATNGEAVLDRETFDRLTALFDDPSRKMEGTGKPPSHLLSGIAVCALCGDKMRVLSAWSSPNINKKTKAAYNCRGCFKTRRDKAALDAWITDLIVARLENPAFLAGFDTGNRAAEIEAREALATIDARLDIAADQFADGTITGDQLRRISERLRADRERFAAAIADAMPRTLPGILTGDNPAAAFRVAPLEVQRATVDALCAITILPARTSPVFESEFVRVEWR